MKFTELTRLYRRAIFLYLATVILPAFILLWLGLRSFETQRRALAKLEEETVADRVENTLRSTAERLLSGHEDSQDQGIVQYRFTMENGEVTIPALRAPLPKAPPPEFSEGDRQLLDHPELALKAYQALLASHLYKSLALSRIASTLARLGRAEESHAVWHVLATSYPNDRDLSYRPYGIVAAINARETQGLYEMIASGRWELSADQAEHFIAELDPKRTTPYLDQFRFARELQGQFHPSDALREGEVGAYSFAVHEVFYTNHGFGRIIGYSVNKDWVDHTLRPKIAAELKLTDHTQRDLRVYGGVVAAVLLILSAGVCLLWRDLARETRMNRLRSEFVSSVSHELKTPITVIRLYGETLLRGIDDQHRHDFYRIIMRESIRLGRLVEGILRFSRVERGDQIYSFEEGDLAPVIGRVVDDYREFLERSGFRLERALPESGPPVRFDAAALSQAIVNLLDNAVKYSGDSREIAVRLANQNGSVMFEVEDHGIGVPSSEREKIFERFYRAPNGSSKGGYGIGLFLVRHIMDAHGGRTEVESEPGQGSRFRLVFPVVTA